MFHASDLTEEVLSRIDSDLYQALCLLRHAESLLSRAAQAAETRFRDDDDADDYPGEKAAAIAHAFARVYDSVEQAEKALRLTF